MSRWFRPLSLALALTFGVTAGAACYGKFPLTKKVYTWNGQATGSALVNNLLFWALLIIPVYELAGLGDAIILNLIEFWTGSNPMASADGAPAIRAYAQADGSVIIERAGQRYELRSVGTDRVEVRQDGSLVGTAERAADGGLALEDLRNGKSAHLSSDEVDEARPTLDRWAGELAPRG